MNDHVTDRLTESLRRQAGQLEPGPSIEAAARGRARRIRRRRRVLAGTAVIVAVAIALPFGIAATDGTRKTELASADAAKPSPTPEREAVEVELDLDQLPAGDAPEIPWYADGVVHDGDEEISIGELPNEPHEVYFSRVADSYVATIASDLPWTAGATEPTYTTRLLAAGVDVPDDHIVPLPTDGRPVVSADGQTMAWGQRPAPSRELTPKRLTLADTPARPWHRSPVIANAEQLAALGFMGGRVVFSADTGDSGFTGTWDPETDEVSRIPGLEWSEDMSGDGLLLGWLSATSGGCVGAVELLDEDGGDERWRDCDLSLAKFTGDDSYAVAPVEGELIDPATGDPVLRIQVEGTEQSVSTDHFQVEPDGDVLFRVRRGGDEALVRCSTEGECELATEIHEGSYPDPHYALID